MSLAACAGIVERGDPDRFAAVMAAPPAARARLLPLYAFNLEVARAPWVSKEPMIAEMRLQWWRDVVAEPVARAHEVAAPFHAVIREAGLPLPVIDRLIAARLHDAWGEPFADGPAFEAYLDDTAGGLMWLAAVACGGHDEAAARALGWASGLANYLRAVPELEARGRMPLPDGRASAVQALATEGLARLDAARGRVPKAAALAAWQARGLLRQVLADPGVVAGGRMGLSEFSRRGGLLWVSVTGRL
ncbi:squalene/phytoene synthase family protein [Tabrizicola oligotrophica]|uniref:Squalene/phytoene synthase family protein n=1 Tax=Tabrizicola oligotrophica TaxID=2710650 RepID=A0A6M0QPQ3_9RHOB|nr:squalene/phytoene synthase family protein [Tabrizicola oligotrophica]NEY89121.1 squalene/phytoene synthase family protein [Tabrizicola oligotrophica]